MRFVQIGNPHLSCEASFQRGCRLFGIEYEKVEDVSQIHGTPDLIWAPLKWIDIDQFKCKILFGPQFFVFPTAHCELVTKSDQCVYNCLSEWNKVVHEEFLPNPGIPYVCIPFGIYMPPLSTKPRTKVVVYYKLRPPKDLAVVVDLLSRRGIPHTMVMYGKYRAEDYAALLDESKYMVVVDRHESQGYALQEAMARNVPLLVYDVTTMKEEYVGIFPYQGYKEALKATAVPYWDSRCGERTVEAAELNDKLTLLESRLDSYAPREFIEETLSDASFQTIVDFAK